MLKKYFSYSIVSLMLMACTGGQTSSNEEGLAVDSDSIYRADSIAKAPLPAVQLPSVDNIVYSITRFDTVTDGTIADLTNLYADAPGSMTFRGGPLRDANYGGKVKGTPKEIVNVWTFKTEYDGTQTSMGSWGGGSGWTGQPVFVKWPDEIASKFKKDSVHVTADFSKDEIIVGSLCGKVYFINFESGKASRTPLNVTNPIKGSVSLDPRLNGNLFVGQGIPKVQPMGQMAFNLFTHEQTFFSGRDANAWVTWGAFDSSPIVVGDFLFWPGENGTIYKYLIKDNTLKLHTTLRFHAKDDGAAGVENSICIYKNYGWFGNNHGDMLCIDLNTMQPIWHYDNHDDIDASIVCEIVDDTPYLYCGCEVDRQGNSGISHFVKLNGLTGEKVWETEIPCSKLNMGGKHFDGGFYSTPLLGRGDCDSLIFANVCQRNNSGRAEFTAFNRHTGEIVYQIQLKNFAWSSPVGFLNEKNKYFIFAGDASGNAYLIDAKKGEIIFTQVMCNNFESSPVVVGNQLVVGSRGQEIHKFEIR